MILMLLGGGLWGCSPQVDQQGASAEAAARFAVSRSETEWKKLLPAQTFAVMRKHDTEPPFNNKYDRNKADGVYYCASCGQHLYDAKHKYDSGTGWPSFYKPIETSLIGTRQDNTLFSVRTEVHCSRCGGHLGHVFDDGPKPTGLRYCMNSAALSFHKRGETPPPLLK
ncbi:MAG: peptide-methionine (R)-S-oxide reductase [Candidatus Melainabacteria bacterium HGW-Melainabacteria-1]|nr:MAG: peptide-methionine (R)-S-oxide reductase [Candidatus Melainabacteria bacterium HGW-Melainabacteria-1]